MSAAGSAAASCWWASSLAEVTAWPGHRAQGQNWVQVRNWSEAREQLTAAALRSSGVLLEYAPGLVLRVSAEFQVRLRRDPDWAWLAARQSPSVVKAQVRAAGEA